MTSINKTKTAVSPATHANFMNGESYDIRNPITLLRTAAASCFFGEPQYYEEGEIKVNLGRGVIVHKAFTHASKLEAELGVAMPKAWQNTDAKSRMELAIDNALDYSVEKTLQVAVSLRNEGLIRVTPQVILVRAAMHKGSKGTDLITRYAPQIIKRADEPATGMAYLISAYADCKRANGKTRIPNSLKKAWRNSLATFNEYQIGKYRMENREVKTVDVVNLVRPTRTPAIDKLVKGTLKVTGQTWEAVRSAGGTWEEAFDVMGHMALLRNLRNLLQDKSVPVDVVARKLVEGAKTGKQFPFRYVSAFQALLDAGITNPVIIDAIEECLKVSMDNMPKFAGRTMSLCDNSGSAQGAMTSQMGTMKISTIGNLTGVLTGQLSDEGYIGIFGDKLDVIPVRKNRSIFDILAECEKSAGGIGGGTENGVWLFFKNALKNKDKFDNIFIYSDMQAGHGGLYGLNPGDYKDYVWGAQHLNVAKLIAKYRKEVNPNVQVFLVQVAGYQDTLVPEHYPNTYVLGGWSDGVIRFAAEMNALHRQ